MTTNQIIKEFKDDLAQIMDIKFESVNRTIAAGAIATSEQIRELKETLKSHNGRLRESEVKDILNAERIKTLKERVSKQAGIYEKEVLEIRRLKRLEKALLWIDEHPYRFYTVAIGFIGSGISLTAFLAHLIS